MIKDVDSKLQGDEDVNFKENQPLLHNDDDTLEQKTADDYGESAAVKDLRRFYDIIKFIGVIIYNCSLMTMVAYYVNSRFCSKYVMQVFGMFLAARPIFIIAYSWSMSCTIMHDARLQAKKLGVMLSRGHVK